MAGGVRKRKARIRVLGSTEGILRAKLEKLLKA
jgi:hypothetical protein